MKLLCYTVLLLSAVAVHSQDEWTVTETPGEDEGAAGDWPLQHPGHPDPDFSSYEAGPSHPQSIRHRGPPRHHRPMMKPKTDLIWQLKCIFWKLFPHLKTTTTVATETTPTTATTTPTTATTTPTTATTTTASTTTTTAATTTTPTTTTTTTDPRGDSRIRPVRELRKHKILF
ncbi:integumentary mucin C.1-like isoform X2 [Sphaeramia orbicularis]|uniref:integumentary mucin C.1-like isoform X2 n=1 Tax=Sphaeramia orbicularis TaxID=375764 RepID=UPI0011816C02|nr:integumentary mucin C.1-like isoform X2 [Sphaeramia orbicularis]